MKRKSEVLENQCKTAKIRSNGSGDADKICDIISSISGGKKYKKIKVSIEFIEWEWMAELQTFRVQTEKKIVKKDQN